MQYFCNYEFSLQSKKNYVIIAKVFTREFGKTHAAYAGKVPRKRMNPAKTNVRRRKQPEGGKSV